MTSVASSTERSRERSNLARLAVMVAGLERAVSTVSSFVRVGLLAYLMSNRDYGLYVAVLGVVATANLLDLGLHFGVVSAVSRALGEDDDDRIRSIVSTGAAVYTAITLLALVVTIPGVLFGPIEWVFGLLPDQVAEARVIALVGFGGLLLTFPTKVAGAGLMGLQQSYAFSAYRTIFGIVQTVGLVVVALVWPGRVIPIAVAGAVLDVGSGVVLTLWAGARHPTQLRLSLARVDLSLLRSLLGTGLTFFMANLANLLRRTFVTVAISHALGTAMVPRFSVPFALFLTGLALTDVLSGSIWPAYGEAAVRGDWSWVERTFRLSTRAALLVAFAIAALGVVSGDEVLRLWAPRVPSPTLGVLLWFAFWLVAHTYSSAAASLLNGLARSRLVMIVVSAEGVLTMLMVVFLVRFFGIVGAAAALALSSAAGAFFLNEVSVPSSTERKVRGELAAIVRLLPLGAVASAIGLAVERPLTNAVLRLLAGASCTALVYGLCAWFLVMTEPERATIGGWVARRVKRAR